ncbi:MAG: hypothetical protein IKT79_01340 [Akkermansia sp.]|nr:hypothetical protein [Akkermansia sp.]
MNKPSRFSLFLLLLALCSIVLSSCVTIIDTGSMLDDVGKQSPSRQIRFVEEKKPLQSYYTGEKLHVWEKEGIYYVQLPVAYIPSRVKNRDFLVLMTMYCSVKDFTYPRLIMDEKEVIQFQQTKEYFYAVLSKEQFNKAINPCSSYFESLYRENYAVLPASDVDLRQAKKWNLPPSQQSELDNYAVTMIEQLPDRRTTGNQLRRPLALLLDIADVPLSIAATPIAWVADFIHVCFSD